LVNWKAGQVHFGSRLHRCCTRLVILLLQAVVQVAVRLLLDQMAVAAAVLVGY
jgi:hypothetical protein